jgi:gluconokinase
MTETLPRTLVVMGVSGCGKSLIGSMLARHLGGVFEDADDFHPPGNKAKMSEGLPLTDADRWPWYQILRGRIMEHRSGTRVYVLACSALKAAYREKLRDTDGPGELRFVYLKGARDLIGARIGARKNHFMPPALLDSQIATLEEPADAMVADVSGTPGEIVDSIIRRLPPCR